jgi:hypothetical protein
MALASFDLLASYSITPVFSSHSGALDRLEIRHARAGLRIPFEPDAQPFAYSPVDPLPGAIDAPSSEVVVDGWPSGEIVREQAPLAATLQEVEDGVQDLAKAVGSGPPMSLGGWQVRFDIAPFGIG